MSPRRGARVAPPPGPDEWDVRFLDNEVAKGWEELCRHAPGSTRDAWTTMRLSPSPPWRAPRHHRMPGGLATRIVTGRALDRWQIEVTGAGRIWYLADRENATIWIDHAWPGHPKATG
jgi:hypothetical protein